MSKKAKAKLETKARLKIRINKFLGECLRDHNRLDIEQGKRFASEFQLASLLIGANSLVPLVGPEVGTEIIRVTHSLKHMALSRGFFIDYIVGRIDVIRFTQCLIGGFEEEIKRLAELNEINKAALKMLTNAGVTKDEKDAVIYVANTSGLRRNKPGARIHKNDNAKSSTRNRQGRGDL